MSGDPKALDLVSKKLQIGTLKRHMFICLGPKCCSEETGAAVWEHLKARLKQPDALDKGIFRTKVGCLRVCRDGPVALVYPEGTWYAGVTEEVCDKIVAEHLINGNPVKEHVFAERNLQR